jgi:hypothetical protein
MDKTSSSVYLRRLVAELYLDLGASRSDPQEDVLTGVKDHDVVRGEVVLAEVGTFLAHREVSLLVGAPKAALTQSILSIEIGKTSVTATVL